MKSITRKFFFCITFLIIQSLYSDEIYLKNGGKLEGTVVEKGEQVEITTLSGSKIVLNKSDIERIVKKELKQDEKKEQDEEKPFFGDIYRDAVYRFQMKIPNKWERGPTSKGAVVTFWADRDKEYPSVLDVILLVFADDLNELVENYKSAFLKEYKDAKLSNEKSVELKNGIKGIQIEIQFKFEKIALHFFAFFTELQELKAVVLFKSSEKNFQQFVKQAKSSIYTFDVCEGEPLPEEDRKTYLENIKSVKEKFKSKQLVEAKEILNKVLEKVPDDTEALKLLGLIHSNAGNWKEAIETFEKILKIIPESVEANYLIGNEYLLNRQYEKASTYFKKVIEINKEYAPAYYGIAVTLDGLGQSFDAIGMLKKSIECDKDYAPAHFLLGTLYTQRKMIKEAIKEFEEVLRIEPNNLQAKAKINELKGKK